MKIELEEHSIVVTWEEHCKVEEAGRLKAEEGALLKAEERAPLKAEEGAPMKAVVIVMVVTKEVWVVLWEVA